MQTINCSAVMLEELREEQEANLPSAQGCLAATPKDLPSQPAYSAEPAALWHHGRSQGRRRSATPFCQGRIAGKRASSWPRPRRGERDSRRDKEQNTDISPLLHCSL